MPPVLLVTDRLEIRPLSARAIAALRHGDRATLEADIDAHFGTPLAPPPLLADALPHMEERLRAHPDELGWWAWCAIRRDDRKAIGAAGFGGRPDAEGRLVLGYATYATAEGRGYATEAVRALLDWAAAQAGVRCIAARIPQWHVSSRRVAQKAGMTPAGLEWDAALGEDVELWTRELS